MKRFWALILAALTLGLFFGCASAPTDTDRQAKAKTFKLTSAEEILSQMTTEEKVAQLFVILPEQLLPGTMKEVSPAFARELSRYPVGGFILFTWHVENPKQVRTFTSALKDASSIPPILAIDEEGGRVAHLANSDALFLPRFKSTGATGDTGNVENARGAGQIIGSYLTTFGFTMNFAPVADVNTNPENIVIGRRAFSSDPKIVSAMAGAFLSGLHSTGIKGSLKHFPGHGDTRGDTHADYVAVTKNWEELKKCELIPFVENFSAADTVMVAHVTCKTIDDTYPASLSKKLITGKLRGELGYKGVILTDALNMGAIEKNYGSAEAAVLAFEAGNDILLMPKNFHAAYDGVLSAVQSGRIPMTRLNESVLRILKLKDF